MPSAFLEALLDTFFLQLPNLLFFENPNRISLPVHSFHTSAVLQSMLIVKYVIL